MTLGTRTLARIILPAVGLLALVTPVLRGAAETPRTVYISAVDATGQPVGDLAASDLVVKEGGQTRQVTALARATERCHIAILVDDGGAGSMQKPVADLMNAAFKQAAFSISMLNPQALRLNDYSNDVPTLGASIGRLVQRGRIERDLAQLSDAVSWTAKDMRKRKLSRPVIVALTDGGEMVDRETSRAILEDLRASGASLHLVHAVGVDLGSVSTEGPKLSGGSSVAGSNTTQFSEAMAAIARTLANQYQLAYVLPDGVKPADRLEVTTTRAGAKIVAPTRIPSQ
jgi:hypothetical protein